MKTAKYLIYGGRRWREVYLDAGLGIISRGKLGKSSKTKILVKLRAFVDSETYGEARDRLRLKEKRSFMKLAHRKRTRSYNSHQHCCFTTNKCPISNALRKSGVPEMRSSKKLTENTGTQTDIEELNNITTKAENYPTPKPSKRKHIKTSNVEAQTSHDETQNATKAVHYDRITTQNSNDTAKERPKLTNELNIEVEDIMILRSCIEVGKLFPDADLEKFDTSDDYKRSLFYQLNPLVYVNRSKKIAEMLKAIRSSENYMTRDQFLSTLGLTHVKRVKKPKRYPVRNTIPQCNSNRKDDDSQKFTDDNDKENHSTTKITKENPIRKKVEILNASVAVNKTLSPDKNKLTQVHGENILPNKLRVRSGGAESGSGRNSDRPKPQNKDLKITTNLDENNKIPNELKVVLSKNECSFEKTKNSQTNLDLSNKILSQKIPFVRVVKWIDPANSPQIRSPPRVNSAGLTTPSTPKSLNQSANRSTNKLRDQLHNWLTPRSLRIEDGQ